MEAFGLAVIVILIALGILFTLQFTVLSKPTEVRQPFVEQQLASNLLGAILVTTVTQDCPTAKDFTDLFTDYARCENSIKCNNDLQGSYEYGADKIKYILDNAMNVSNKAYSFRLCVFDNTSQQCAIEPSCLKIEDPKYPNCSKLTVTPARFYLPLGGGLSPATVELNLC